MYIYLLQEDRQQLRTYNTCPQTKQIAQSLVAHDNCHFSCCKRSGTNVMCSSGKNRYPPNGRLLEIPIGRGGGVLKAKFLEAMYENKLEFPVGRGGAKQKTFRGGSIDIFWHCTITLYGCRLEGVFGSAREGVNISLQLIPSDVWR